MVWIELLILAGGGALLGMGAGAAVTLWLGHTGIVYPIDPKLLAQFGVPQRLLPQLSWTSAIAGPGALLVVVLLGALVPYARIRRMTPAIAMRSA
jgi:ABC-type antimicrobial peptide transport system permease subunit